VPVGGVTIAGNTVGDTVVMGRTWDTATSSPGPAENLANFKIGPLAPGRSGSYRFVKPGDYFCNDCAGFP
jgi:hypothetical protein